MEGKNFNVSFDRTLGRVRGYASGLILLDPSKLNHLDGLLKSLADAHWAEVEMKAAFSSNKIMNDDNVSFDWYLGELEGYLSGINLLGDDELSEIDLLLAGLVDVHMTEVDAAYSPMEAKCTGYIDGSCCCEEAAASREAGHDDGE